MSLLKVKKMWWRWPSAKTISLAKYLQNWRNFYTFSCKINQNWTDSKDKSTVKAHSLITFRKLMKIGIVKYFAPASKYTTNAQPLHILCHFLLKLTNFPITVIRSRVLLLFLFTAVWCNDFMAQQLQPLEHNESSLKPFSSQSFVNSSKYFSKTKTLLPAVKL